MASMLPGEAEDLRYEAGGRRLIDGLSFRLEQGPRTVLLGPNGAGKSLTLRLLHGLLRPSSGRISWQSNDARRQQALVFQRPVMLRRSAAANIDFALKQRGLDRSAREARSAAVLEATGMTALADRPARALSVGEQQRLALARAWAMEPQVLFLDEPTASLDPAATRAVENIVAAIHESGTKIVLTTHDLGQARRLADQVFFLHQGRLVEEASAETFFDAPQSREAAAFLKGELLW